MANTYGLTINKWPGTWSPSATHPIVLDGEIRGSLRTITGDSGDKLSNITGQRLQDGMIVYVQNTHTDSAHNDNLVAGQQYYKYSSLLGEYRDLNTGTLVNEQGNWSLIRLGIGLDSSEIIQLIDSDYVSDRIDFDPIYDAIDAAVQVVDIMDFIGEPGLDGQFLISNGDNSFQWKTFSSLGLDSNKIIQLIDSDHINSRVDANIDSNAAISLITETVDAAYINARVTITGGGGTGTVDSPAVIDLIHETLPSLLDSDFILTVVDSAFIQSARPQYVDSAYLNDIVDAKLQVIDLEDFASPAEHPGQYFISDGAGGAGWRTIGSLGLDSAHIITLIDSDYINARSDIDAAAVETIIDQTYVESKITQNFLINTLPSDFGSGTDEAAVIDLINQYAPGSVNVDSAYILTIVDSAFIQAARPQLVDSAYLNDIVDAKLQVFDILDNIIEEEGTVGQILKYAGNGEFIWRDLNDLDSNLVIRIFEETELTDNQLSQSTALIPSIVDSDYVQERVTFTTTVDSDFVETVFATKNLSYFLDSQGDPENVLHSRGDGTYYWSNLDNDSSTVIQITNIIQGNVDIPNITLPTVLDSNQIIDLIDSDYVNSRATFEIDSGEVVGIIYNTVDSAFFYSTIVDVTTEVVDAKVQALDFGDLAGGNGNAGQYLKSLGNGDIEWVDLATEINDIILSLSADSAEVRSLINSTYINNLVDLSSVPATITSIVDAAYINARVTITGGGGTGTVDSPAVIDLIQETVNTSYLEPIVTSIVSSSTLDLIHANIQALDISDLIGYNGAVGQFLVSKGDGDAEWKTFTEFGLDSATTINLIDSDYVYGRVVSNVEQLIDSDYILAKISSELGDVTGVDSVATLALITENSIDSSEATSLIQDIALDSAEITYFIRDLIHANIQVIDFQEVFGIPHGPQGTYLKSAGNSKFEWGVVQVDEALVIPTVLDVVDSDFLESVVNAGYINSLLDRSLFLDSAEAIALIDSDYINARIDPAVDSEAVLALIDSDYINLRVDPAVDSNGVIALIDSDYINARVFVDTGTDSATVLDIVIAEINALDIGDVVGDNGAAGYFLKSLGNGHAEWSEVSGAGGGGLNETQVLSLITNNAVDSADVTSIINNSYVTGIINNSYVTGIINNSYVTGFIDSDYINLRVDPAVDSNGVIALIDSDYINARVTMGSGTDSATVLDMIVAEVNALDIGDVVGDNGSAGNILQSSGNGHATWEPKGILPTIGGQVTLGTSPVWKGSAGIDSASQVSAGSYRITFNTSYNTDSDYSIITTYQGLPVASDVYVNVNRSTNYFDVYTLFDSGAVSILVYEF